MTDWRTILNISYLHFNDDKYSCKNTWCAWTTFSRMNEKAGYWSAPLPNADELLEFCTADGGAWGQPFPYNDLAHIIIPHKFILEFFEDEKFYVREIFQDIEGLSLKLTQEDITHYLSNYALEVKIY